MLHNSSNLLHSTQSSFWSLLVSISLPFGPRERYHSLSLWSLVGSAFTIESKPQKDVGRLCDGYDLYHFIWLLGNIEQDMLYYFIKKMLSSRVLGWNHWIKVSNPILSCTERSYQSMHLLPLPLVGSWQVLSKEQVAWKILDSSYLDMVALQIVWTVSYWWLPLPFSIVSTCSNE